ncbi:MAG: DNA starvation/stationary phase protection protein [Scytonema sp. PMC 1069.18]|nr:DNA starvation/stationary phase protection protein [Scytonema sp. PMC 1069.18]MEC4884755.1 DNA starvation/stationary phase protection protein [Scytonema sp. PMC 1070.18]
MVSNAANQTSTKSARSDSSNGIKMFPSPQQLATPTDLKPEHVKAVVEAVNPLIADAYALYLKTKNYHWHLSGSHFRDYHLLFQEQADSILESVDPLAERMRRIGGTTIRSITHISHLQSIADDNSEFVPPDEMIQNLLDDNCHIAQRQRAAIHICEENHDYPTANILEEVLDQTEKRIWFLYEISQGGQNMK